MEALQAHSAPHKEAKASQLPRETLRRTVLSRNALQRNRPNLSSTCWLRDTGETRVAVRDIANALQRFANSHAPVKTGTAWRGVAAMYHCFFFFFFYFFFNPIRFEFPFCQLPLINHDAYFLISTTQCAHALGSPSRHGMSSLLRYHRSCHVAVVPASGNSREMRGREREYW